MKTKNQIIIVLALLACFLFPKTSMAQPSCSYHIDNQLPCAIKVTIYWYDNCSSIAGFCDSQTLSIPASTPAFPNCSNCGPLCDIVVMLTTVGGAPISGAGTVDDGTFSSTMDAGGTVSCNNNISYNMNWTPLSTVIRP